MVIIGETECRMLSVLNMNNVGLCVEMETTRGVLVFELGDYS